MPWLRTVALSVMRSPAAGVLSLTEGVSTTRSGVRAGPPTVTVNGSDWSLVNW